MNDENVIIDRSAWKNDDPKWVKARKQRWREIRRSLEYTHTDGGMPFSYIRKKDHTRLKEYFLTGYVTSKPSFGEGTPLFPPPNDPLQGIEAEFLFLIWLHADNSQENWEALRETCGFERQWLPEKRQQVLVKGAGLWPKTQSRFLESMNKYPTEGTLFGESEYEGRLYRLICPQEGVYAPHRKRSPQLNGVHGFQMSLAFGLFHFFERSSASGNRHAFIGNPNHIARHGLRDYISASSWLLSDEGKVALLNPAVHQKDILDKLIDNVCRCYLALELQDSNPPVYAEVARELLEMVETTDWPTAAQHILEVGLKQSKKEMKQL